MITYRFLRDSIRLTKGPLLLETCLMVFALSASAQVWFSNNSPNSAPSLAASTLERPPQAASTTLLKDDPERSDVEVVTLTPLGFEPQEITRPTGQFLLVVHDRSGLDEINLRLDREAGNRLHDVRVETGRLDWRTPLDLHPGHYILTEAGHPEWSCRINVTAR